jgi:signal transduction histidine kinase/CheY-like chemotaxis protein
MSFWGPEALDHVEEAIAEVRGAAGVQVLADVLVAVGFGALAGWGAAAVWFAITILLRVIHFAAIGYAERRQATRQTRATLNLLFMSCQYLLLGCMGMIAFFRAGPWAGMAALQIVTGSILFSSHAARKSIHAYVAFVGPLAVHAVILWCIACYFHAPLAVLAGLGVIGLTTLGMSVNIWRLAAASAITERKALLRAEAATAAKSAFVAVISHELRTPISGILAGADEIWKTNAETGTRRNAELIADSGKMMRRLLDDLLDLSKIEAGRMTAEQIDFDLRKLVHDAARFWSPEARRQNLRFRLAGAHALPRWVTGDPTRVRQILNNLFSNALKFTADGAVTLRMAVVPLIDQRVRITLEVADTGQGMNPSQMDRMFQAFDQLSASTARTHGGTGLGLNISRQLAQLMGGDLTASSVEGEGSTFRLTFEAPLGSPVAAPEPAAPELGAARGVRVLVVDDHAINRQAFSLILQSVCEEVVCLADGDEALSALALRPFDVVLMDLNMPRVGGMEATRRLRAADGPNRTTPVIALTASVSPTEADACRAAGMNSFVLKPVEARELIAALNAVLSDEPAASQSAVA